MGMIDNLLQRFGYTKAQPAGAKYPDYLLAAAANEEVYAPDWSMQTAQLDLYRRLSWVYTAVSILAENCAVVPLSVKKRTGEKTDDISNHPFELLLDAPNPRDSRFELMRDTIMYLALNGTAYWFLNRASETATTDEIWMIEPNRLRPIPDGRMYLSGWYYDTGSVEMPIPTWSVLQFKSFNPFDRWVGLSGVEPVAVVAAGDMAQQKWNTKNYANNNGRLPGILEFADPINDSDWEKIKREIRENAQKREMMLIRNAGAGGAKWVQTAISNKEMEFLQSRDFTKQEIFNVFAPGLVSILSENATEANAKTGKATFTEFAEWPKLTLMAQKITAGPLKAYGDGLLAEFDDIRVTDRMLEIAEMTEYAKTHTIDEVRAKYYGDDPVATITGLDGDKRGLLFTAQINASTPIEDEPEPEPAPPVMPVNPPPGQPPETMGEPEPETMPDEGEQEGEPDPALKRALGAWKRYAVRMVKAGRDATTFEHDDIPGGIKAQIAAGLTTCKSAEDVAAVFASRGQRAAGPDVAALLEGIRAGVEALKVA